MASYVHSDQHWNDNLILCLVMQEVHLSPYRPCDMSNGCCLVSNCDGQTGGRRDYPLLIETRREVESRVRYASTQMSLLLQVGEFETFSTYSLRRNITSAAAAGNLLTNTLA